MSANKKEFTINRKFKLVEEVTTVDVYKARDILLSDKINNYSYAQRINGNAQLTSYFFICPICGEKTFAYPNDFPKKFIYPKETIESFCDEQIAINDYKTQKSLFFCSPLNDWEKAKCSNCGKSSVISNDETNCVITVEDKKLTFSCEITDIADLMNMSWLGNEARSFDSTNLYENMSFDLKSGKIEVSLTSNSKQIAKAEITLSKILDEKDLCYEALSNIKATQNIESVFCDWYGKNPFSNKKLNLNRMILLTKFVGYDERFYEFLPFCIDDKESLIPDDFEDVAKELHNISNLPILFPKMKLPQTRYIKKVLLKYPVFFMYRNELERLLKIFDDENVFCITLKSKCIFNILSILHRYKVDDYFIELRTIHGALWLKNLISSSDCNDAVYHAQVYYSASSFIRKKMLKSLYTDNRYEYMYDSSEYFSKPTVNSFENIKDESFNGYKFVLLRTTNQYNELESCLNSRRVKYPVDNERLVFKIMYKDEILGAANIYDDGVAYPYCKNDKKITDKALLKALAKWKQTNRYKEDKTD